MKRFISILMTLPLCLTLMSCTPKINTPSEKVSFPTELSIPILDNDKFSYYFNDFFALNSKEAILVFAEKNSTDEPTGNTTLLSLNLENGDYSEIFYGEFNSSNSFESVVNITDDGFVLQSYDEVLMYKNNVATTKDLSENFDFQIIAISPNCDKIVVQKTEQLTSNSDSLNFNTDAIFLGNDQAYNDQLNTKIYLIDLETNEETFITSGVSISCHFNEDSTQIVMLKNYTNIGIFDLNTSVYKEFNDGTHYSMPEGLVDYSSVDFTPNSENIILSALLENGDCYQIIDAKNGDIIAQYDGKSREDILLDAYSDTLLIAKRFEDYDTTLVIYDYKADKETEVLVTEKTAIMDAEISSGGEVFFAVAKNIETQNLTLVVDTIN